MDNILIIAIIAFLIVFGLGMAWKLGKLEFLCIEIPLISRKKRSAQVNGPMVLYSARRFESIALLIVALAAFQFADYVGRLGVLCILYGISRVRAEGLHFTSMPNGHPWTVSNGDEVASALHSLHFAICAIVWIICTVVTFMIVRTLLLTKKASIGEGFDGQPDGDIARNRESWKRVSLLKKGTPFRKRAMGYLTFWVLVMAFLGVLAPWIGRIDLILLPSVSILLYFAYTRSHSRHFVSMVMTTECPECKNSPMRYESPRERNGMNQLLICDKCHTEWDLGAL
jgi:hypothetical protein